MSREHEPCDAVALTRRRILGSGVAVSAAFLAGCIGGDDPEEGNGGTDADRLNFTQQVAPIEWDPVVLNDAYSNQITQCIYDGLYEYEPGELEPVPKLAAAAPEIEDDGQRFIVELVDNAEFHNGDPVTAEDVIHTFMAPIEEETDNMPDVDMIESAEEVDEHTVEFNLEYPYAPFETVTLAREVVNAEARQDDREAYNQENPIGSGPYQFVDAEIGEFVDIEVWDDYWDEPSQVPAIRFEPAEDDAARVSRILAQETHIMEGIPPQDWDQVHDEEGIAVSEVESTGYLYMAFNCQEGPTEDLAVRQAIAHCHDPQNFVETQLGDAAAEINMPMSPRTAETFDIDPGQFDDLRYEFDPDQAKELLDDSDAIDDGEELNIIVPPDDIRQQWGELVADRLNEIEYGATVQRLDWDTFTNSYTSGDADEFNIYTLGWTGGADPDVYLYQLFHQDNEGITQGHFYPEDELSDMITEARQSIDEEERSQLYTELSEYIVENVIHIPGWSDMNAVAYVEDQVDGVQASTTTSNNPHLDHPDLTLL